MKNGVTAFALLALLAATQLALAQPLEVLYVLPGGLVQGYVVFTVPETGFAEFKLPGSVESLGVTGTGSSPPVFNLSGGVLSVLADPGSTVNASFVSRLPRDSVTTLSVPAENQSLKVYVSSEYVVLGVSPTPTTIAYTQGYVLLGFDVLAEDLQVVLVETGSAQAGQGAPAAQQGGAPQLQQLLPYAVLVAVAVAAVLLALRLKRRGEGGVVLEEDEAILDFLRRSGGRAYLKEIREALGIPSTTLLRRVRRLEKAGYLRLEKTPGGLLVILKK